jgi:hypothetical protein
MTKSLIAALLLILSTSCLYRMPDEGEVHTIPTTNNREITREKAQNWSPSVDY